MAAQGKFISSEVTPGDKIYVDPTVVPWSLAFGTGCWSSSAWMIARFDTSWIIENIEIMSVFLGCCPGVQLERPQ